MSIRLSVLNSETAKRTRDLYAFVQAVSMSENEKVSDMRQSASSKSLEQRREYFMEKQQ